MTTKTLDSSSLPTSPQPDDAPVVLPPAVLPQGFFAGIGESMRSLSNHRDLLFLFVWREVQIRYKQSVMGLLWAVFMPAMIVGAGLLVRYAFSALQDRPLETNEIVAVSVKAIPWSFFVASVRSATNSLISNVNLVTKVYFPREIIPLSAVLSQTVDFAVASVVVLIICTVAQVGVSVQLLWVPIILAAMFLFTTGLGVMMSAASLFFRDVKYLVEVTLTFAIFFTPVFYETSMFGEKGRWLLLNPVAPMLEALQAVIVDQQAPELVPLGYSIVVAIVTFTVALGFFKRLEPKFAESI